MTLTKIVDDLRFASLSSASGASPLADTIIDLRSDALVPRSPAVARAVAEAFAEAPAFDPGESSFERRLLETSCEMLGTEAALFLPTCTMANQIALRYWLPGGGSVAADTYSHLFTVEQEALRLTGVRAHCIDSTNGHVQPEAVSNHLSKSEESSLVWLENTHNLAGGSVMPEGWQAEISSICQAAGAAVHLDGSRLWNAAVACDSELSTLCAGASSIAVSLNKALGAPLGAILGGSSEMVKTATRLRSKMSGEWRPLGPLAAGALAALPGWRARLQSDHETAADLVARLRDTLGEDVPMASPTNLVLLRCGKDNARCLSASLGKRGLRVLPIGDSMVRLAIHGGMPRRSVDHVVQVLTQTWLEMIAGPAVVSSV